ncbi:MAG TPA: hypothetical protein VKZ41_06865 [Gemmatimonadales bacterium]|nr:hypothetical protein [Gemmatimonadales bacterium]
MAATRKRLARGTKGASAKQADSSLVNEKVLAQAVRALRKNPDIKSNVLYDQAQSIDPEIAKLDRRVFHMRYAMRARRILKAEERGSSPRPKKATSAPAAAPAGRKMRAMGKKRGRKAEVPAAGDGYSDRDRNTIRAALTATMKDALQAQSKEDLVALFDSIDSRTEKLLQLTSR